MEENGYKLILQCLIKLLDEGVYIVDSKGVGLFYNEAMSSIEKVQIGDVIGQDFHKAFPGVAINNSTMFKALEKKEATYSQEQTYKNLYGKEITTVNSTVPVVHKGEVVAAIEVAKDITAFQKLRDRILELEEKKASKPSRNPEIKRYTFSHLIGKSKTFVEAINRGKKASENRASVFIYGETGTGKELFAQSIHYASSRKNKPFVAQNCAALPPTLLEGILFGTAKGGFTGAVDRAGLFEQANGGTLLLDEISAMPYDLQSKLLRVLQENYIRRVGGTKDIPVDVRIIATVNENPKTLIEEGNLRKDLFYRLSVVNINIPPLRERPEDVPNLVEVFLDKYNKEFNKKVWMISEKAMEKLKNYSFPGNVRELENIIAQGVSMADEEHLLSEKKIALPMEQEEISRTSVSWNPSLPISDYLEEIEKNIISETLYKCGGNITKTAETLQLKRQTLQHKLKKYSIDYKKMIGN